MQKANYGQRWQIALQVAFHIHDANKCPKIGFFETCFAWTEKRGQVYTGLVLDGSDLMGTLHEPAIAIPSARNLRLLKDCLQQTFANKWPTSYSGPRTLSSASVAASSSKGPARAEQAMTSYKRILEQSCLSLISRSDTAQIVVGP